MWAGHLGRTGLSVCPEPVRGPVLMGGPAGLESRLFRDISTLPTLACVLSHVLLVGRVHHEHCVSLSRYR